MGSPVSRVKKMADPTSVPYKKMEEEDPPGKQAISCHALNQT